MTYKLAFLPQALKEWEKLDNSIREQFKKKLKERLKNPKNIASQLKGFEDHYKIKLKSSGYRLVYAVFEKEIKIVVIVVGKRNKNQVYLQAKHRNTN